MTKRPTLLPWAGILVQCLLAIPSRPSVADDAAPTANAPVSVRVEGIITYDGPLPEPIPVAEAATFRQPVEVDPESKGLKEAVVWLEGVTGGTEPLPLRQSLQMDQRNFFFLPHVLSVQAGQEVEFLNSDSANHGVTATSLEPKNCFNVSIPLAGERYKHRFVVSTRPVAIGCPVHASMAAWIYVFEHPYHAITDEAGRFHLSPVPPGRYTLKVRHIDGGMNKQMVAVVRAGEPLTLRIDFHERDLKTRDRDGRSSGR